MSQKQHHRPVVLSVFSDSLKGRSAERSSLCRAQGQSPRAYLSNIVSPLYVSLQMLSGSMGSSNRVHIMQLSSV